MNFELERTELVTLEPAVALAGLLGVDPPTQDAGLPLMWHWLYALDRPAQRDLGPDGHPVRGVLPESPGPMRRRMWAGGRVETVAPLMIGSPVTRTSRVAGRVVKPGRSGQLTFVSVSHELCQGDRLVVRERQDIVYRDAVANVLPYVVDGSDVEAPVLAGEWEVEVTPTLLFRFSALTYNAHRIHYDRTYATQVEGYAGLLTHGPLQALCMAEAVRATGTDTAAGIRMDYRLMAPLFDHQGLITRVEMIGDGVIETSVRDRSGRVTARGTVATEEPVG